MGSICLSFCLACIIDKIALPKQNLYLALGMYRIKDLTVMFFAHIDGIKRPRYLYENRAH